MKDLLIVDTRLIAYETYHKHRPITDFFSIVMDETSKYIPPPSRIIFAWDSKKGSKRRKELFPAYKAHRREKKQSVAEQRRLKRFNKNYNNLEEILNLVGNVVHLPDWEADDIANIIVDVVKDKYNIYLLSSDRDWLVNLKGDNIYQIHLKRGLISLHNIEEQFGVLPEYILKVQALTGVVKENVPGVYKLGEKRVYKWLSEGSTMEEIIEKVQYYIDNSKYGMKLPEEFSSVKEMYDFNYEILRPVLLTDLTDDEKNLLAKQFNKKEKGSTEEIELASIEKLNIPILVNKEFKEFYKIC